MSHPNDTTSNDTPEVPTPEQILRVVMGHASAEETRRIRDAVARDADLSRTAGVLCEIRDVMAAVARESADAPPASLFERAKSLSRLLPRPPSWLDRVSALVLARIDEASSELAAGLAPLTALRGGSEPQMASFVAQGMRLDAEARRALDGLHLLRIQLDGVEEGSLAGEFAILDRESGSVVAEGVLDDEGAALAAIAAGSVPAGLVEIAIHRKGRTLLAGEVRLG